MSGDRARARVETLVRVARRLQDSTDEIGHEARLRLPEVTGLSIESIELALADHLETHPTSEQIDNLLKSTTSAPRCHVVMSANVFTAPLRALALALATSDRVYVRASRRDPVLTELLIRMLALDPQFADLGAAVHLTETLHSESGDEVHIYGSDESISSIVSELPEGVLVRAHGTGIGIAVVGENVDLARAAEALSRDVGIFDQRGCLSPRFVFVEGNESRAENFSIALDEAMTLYAQRTPRGFVDAGLQAEIAQYRATMEAIGNYWEGFSHAVGFDPAPRALVLPPAARIVHVVAVNDEKAPSLLEPWIRFVTAVGTDQENGLSEMLREWIPRARFSRLGFMQRPLLDGPVDGRTVPFRTPLRS